ncbi:MAG TPA: hypothetical protein VEX38_05880, partial [Fimbriimonadaceae bacterium]|nr:hypothetical protein [Fimbriimonadaceae bacterium]
GVRFYAGVPLVVEGWPIGALCVWDRTGRNLDMKRVNSLMLLGKLAEANIMERYRLRSLEAKRVYALPDLSTTRASSSLSSSPSF